MNYSAALQHFSVFGHSAVFAHSVFGHSAFFAHSAFAQQLSAFSHGVVQAALWQQLSAITQQLSALTHVSATHSVATWQHSDLHFLSITKYTTAPITQSDTRAINTFFITLKKFVVYNVLISYYLENRHKITLNIAHMQKKLYFCRRFDVFFTKIDKKW